MFLYQYVSSMLSIQNGSDIFNADFHDMSLILWKKRRYVHLEAVDVMRLVGDRKNKNYKNDIKPAQALGGEVFLKYS